jgi:excisionase family DNA binding protein
MSAGDLLREGVFGLDDAMRFTGLGRAMLYRMMQHRELPFTTVGTRRLIPVVALKALLAKQLVGGESITIPAPAAEANDPAKQPALGV